STLMLSLSLHDALPIFSIGFIFLFVIGGFSGVVCAIVPIDVQVQDTYYVIAHFHYVLVSGSLFAIFAGAYYWLPKWTGHMYDERSEEHTSELQSRENLV